VVEYAVITITSVSELFAFTARSTSAFCGVRFPDDIIAVAERWYLRLRLPYADVVILLAQRGVHVDPSTVFDWVQRFTPLYIPTFCANGRPGGLIERWS